jgi:hypothetical protein
MRYRVSAICAAMMFCGWLGAFAAEQFPAELEPVKADYEKSIEKLLENYTNERESATVRYMERLRTALDQYMDKRKLDEAITIRQEMDRIRPMMPATAEGLREGLVLHFTFDKSESDKKVIDESGAGNHGNVSGANWTSKGLKGGAYEFKDDGDQIRVPNKPALNPKQITLAVWIKTNYTDRKWRRIFDKSFNRGIALSLLGDMQNGNTANRGKIGLEIGPNQWCISDSAVANGQWHHVVAVYNGIRQMLFIDSQYQKQMPQWNGIVLPNEFDLTIGSNRSTPPEENGVSFRGFIDEPMVYNRVLSAKEIKLLYETQKSAEK